MALPPVAPIPLLQLLIHQIDLFLPMLWATQVKVRSPPPPPTQDEHPKMCPLPAMPPLLTTPYYPHLLSVSRIEIVFSDPPGLSPKASYCNHTVPEWGSDMCWTVSGQVRKQPNKHTHSHTHTHCCAAVRVRIVRLLSCLHACLLWLCGKYLVLTRFFAHARARACCRPACVRVVDRPCLPAFLHMTQFRPAHDPIRLDRVWAPGAWIPGLFICVLDSTRLDSTHAQPPCLSHQPRF